MVNISHSYAEGHSISTAFRVAFIREKSQLPGKKDEKKSFRTKFFIKNSKNSYSSNVVGD